MWARKRLDLGWSDLAYGAACSLLPFGRERAQRRLERLWSPEGDALACLSVRSGFDLLLSALDLPRGSEVLVSALTIGDMVRIIEEHGLVALPIDLDVERMAPDCDSLRRAITPATRAVLVAHLFGGRIDLEPLLDIAARHRLVVIEDCAQAYAGPDFKGHSRADASMFSFGPIKTATALGGALLGVRDARVLARMRARQAAFPIQSHFVFLTRIVKYSLLKLLSCRPMFGLFVRACRLLGRDYDRLVNGAVRGFAGLEFFARIRRQPNTALLSLLARRLRGFDSRRLAARAQVGAALLAQAGRAIRFPGTHARLHHHWVLPVLTPDPPRLIAQLAKAGFDATQGQSLLVVDAPQDRPQLDPVETRRAAAEIVYLPCYPEIPPAAVARLAQVLAASAASSLPQGSELPTIAAHQRPRKQRGRRRGRLPSGPAPLRWALFRRIHPYEQRQTAAADRLGSSPLDVPACGVGILPGEAQGRSTLDRGLGQTQGLAEQP